MDYDLRLLYSRCNLSDWLNYKGCELVILLGCRSDCFDQIYDFLMLHLSGDDSVLFLPDDYADLNKLFVRFGLCLDNA